MNPIKITDMEKECPTKGRMIDLFWTLKNKKNISKDDKEFIMTHLLNMKNAIYFEGGWAFNFSKFMKIYCFDSRDLGLSKIHSFNKTLLRKRYSYLGIKKIIEVK